MYQFYDIKTKVKGTNGSAWDFEEFTNENDEWTDHESIEDFGYDSNEISENLYNMKLEFVKTFLNEKSQNDLLYSAAVPFGKRDILKEEVDSGIIIDNGCLIYEEGDKSILP